MDYNLEPRYPTETELYIQYWKSVADNKINNNDKEGNDSNGTEVHTR